METIAFVCVRQMSYRITGTRPNLLYIAIHFQEVSMEVNRHLFKSSIENILHLVEQPPI